jgi:DnaJ-domain-containing protein 1
VPSIPAVAPVRPPSIPALSPTAARPTSAPSARPVTPGSTAPIAPFLTPLVPNIAPVAPARAAPGAPAQPGPLDDAQLAELERLAGSLDRLDYFELLGVEKGAPPAEIKRAFYKNSRTWHPDRFYQVRDLALKERVHDVYKRVTEAYAVLRDDVKRPQYLADISGPDRAQKLRFTEAREAEARVQKKKEQEEQIGTTPKGRQFYATAAADLDGGRFSSAERNLKMALTYEPQNARYKEKLKEAQDKLLEESRKSGSQFKIT